MSENEQNKTQAKPVVEAEQKKADKKPAAKPAAKKQSSGGGKGLAWLLVLILIGALAGGGWYGYQWYLKSQNNVAELEQQQQALAQQTQQMAEQLQDRMNALQKNQSELTRFVEVMRDQNQHLRKDWLVMEAEYLLQLANYRLLFERDIDTAVVALQSADARLKDTGDPGLLPVRKSISNAIQSLKQIEQIDLAGLSLTISSLSNEMDKLPLNMPDPKSREGQQGEIDLSAKSVSSWSELPAAIWRDIKSLIVIRDHSQPVAPLLSPEERFFLTENLRLQLEQARLAMLSGQGQIYKERLNTARDWISKHFDTEAALTKSTLDTLQQLADANVAPSLPDISFTYQAMQNYKGADKQAPQPADSNEETSQ